LNCSIGEKLKQGLCRRGNSKQVSTRQNDVPPEKRVQHWRGLGSEFRQENNGEIDKKKARMGNRGRE